MPKEFKAPNIFYYYSYYKCVHIHMKNHFPWSSRLFFNAMDSKLCTWTHEMSHQIKLCQDLKSTHSRPQNSSNCTELQPIRKVTGQRSHTEFCYSKQWNLMYFPCPEPSSIEFLQNRLMIIAAETRKEKAGEGRKECKRWKLSQYSICNLSHYHTIRLGRECTANLQFK